MAGLVDLGSVYATLELKTQGFNKGIDDTGNKLDGLAKRTQKSAFEMGAALENVAKVGLIGLGVAVAAATALIVSNIDNAVKRVDTLNNSARTFENMGIKSEDAQVAIKKLTDSILGLPTPLDAAIRGMTDLTATYGDVGLAQKVFSALNDAIIGFGGSTAEVENAIRQLSQVPLDGPLDGQTWLSLRNSGLTPVIRAMADDMGLSISEMKSQFASGQLTVQDFVDNLIRLDTVGGGGMKALNIIAKDATKGIGTSIENMNTAITRGIANVIRAIGAENIANVITNIGKAFETALDESSGFINFIKDNADFITPMLIGITAFVGAITTFFIAIKAGTAVVAVFNAVMAMNPFYLIAAAIIAVTAGLAYFFTQTETGRAIWQKLVDAFKKFWDLIEPIRSFIKDQLTSAFESLKKVWEQLVTAMQPLIEMFKQFWAEHGEKVMTVLKYIGIAIAAIYLAPLVFMFGMLMAGLKVLAVVMRFVADHFEIIKKVVLVVMGTVLLPLIAIIALVIIAFKILPPILLWIWNVVLTVWNGIVTAWNAIYAVISFVVSAIWTVISTYFNMVWAVVSFVFNLVKDLFTIVFGAILTVVITAVNAIWEVISTVFNAIWGFLQPIIQTIWDFIVNAWNTIKDTVVDTLTKLYDFYSSIWQKIFDVVTGIVKKIVDFFAPAITWLLDKGKNVIQGLIDGIVSMAGSLWSGISQVAAKIGEFFAGAGRWLFDSGKAIFQGLIDGMQSIAGSVKKTAEGIMNEVRRLLPFSPAKEGPFSGKGWTRYSGRALVEGFAQGIKDMKSLPESAMSGVLRNLPTAEIKTATGISTPATSPINFYGDVTIGNQQDADYLLQRLTRRQDLTTQGLTGV